MYLYELTDYVRMFQSTYETHCALYHSCIRHNDRDGELYYRGKADSLLEVLDFLRSCVDAAEA